MDLQGMIPEREPVGPCGKRGYSKKDAQTAANMRTSGRQERRRNRPEFLRAYACECGQWHLTSKRKLW